MASLAECRKAEDHQVAECKDGIKALAMGRNKVGTNNAVGIKALREVTDKAIIKATEAGAAMAKATDKVLEAMAAVAVTDKALVVMAKAVGAETSKVKVFSRNCDLLY